MAVTARTPKQDVERLLSRLPENASLEDIQYHLYLLEKVQRGKGSLAAGGGVSHEQAMERLRRWLED